MKLLPNNTSFQAAGPCFAFSPVFARFGEETNVIVNAYQEVEDDSVKHSKISDVVYLWGLFIVL